MDIFHAGYRYAHYTTATSKVTLDIESGVCIVLRVNRIKL